MVSGLMQDSAVHPAHPHVNNSWNWKTPSCDSTMLTQVEQLGHCPRSTGVMVSGLMQDSAVHPAHPHVNNSWNWKTPSCDSTMLTQVEQLGHCARRNSNCLLQGRRGGGGGCALDTVKVGALLPLLAEVVVDLEVMQVLVLVPVLEVPQGIQGRRGGGRGCAMDTVETTRSTVTTVRGGEQEESRRMRS